MDEKLKATINKIKILSEQNSEFAQEMRKMFGNTSSASVVSVPQKISDDVTAIRQALEIRANNSIDYKFIKEERLRDQLTIDNLRMENAALDLQHTEQERFYTFCINAFYQLENVVNYYFYKTYPNIEELISVIEKYTELDKTINGDFSFRRKGKEKNIGDIPIVYKINAMCNMFYPRDVLKITLSALRQVRNEGEHRCMVIQQEKDESNYLYKFFQGNSFNTIRILLIKVVTTIKENIEKPIAPKIELVEAIICTMFPSMCIIEYEEKKEQIPDKLFRKVRGMQVGDKIQVYISEGKIIDVV